MKFSAVAVLAALCASATVDAFSAVAPPSAAKSASTGGGQNLDPVDKSMLGLDDASMFDPTSGASAALTRNNKGEVWVPQVRRFAHGTKNSFLSYNF